MFVKMYKNKKWGIIDHFTLSLALRKEYRLRVFENRVLRRIFEPKKDEVTERWSTLHEKLHNL
jgi:hypothetical protein